MPQISDPMFDDLNIYYAIKRKSDGKFLQRENQSNGQHVLPVIRVYNNLTSAAIGRSKLPDYKNNKYEIVRVRVHEDR